MFVCVRARQFSAKNSALFFVRPARICHPKTPVCPEEILTKKYVCVYVYGCCLGVKLN